MGDLMTQLSSIIMEVSDFAKNYYFCNGTCSKDFFTVINIFYSFKLFS